MNQTIDCMWPGCTSATIYQDGLCRTHRRMQRPDAMIPNPKTSMSLVNAGLRSSSGESKEWARSVVSAGRFLCAHRPTVVKFDKVYVITSWVKQDEDPSKIEESMRGFPDKTQTMPDSNGWFHLVVPKSNARIEQVVHEADQRYAGYTFTEHVGDYSKLEQYDDAGEAISSLNIPQRFGPGYRMRYMVSDEGEQINLVESAEASSIGKRAEVEATIGLDREMFLNDGTRIVRPQMKVSSSTIDGKRIPSKDQSESMKAIMQQVLYARAQLERFKMVDYDHEEVDYHSSGFFIPAGWQEEDPYRQEYAAKGIQGV